MSIVLTVFILAAATLLALAARGLSTTERARVRVRSERRRDPSR
jgi:hypothetical protein